MLRTFTTGYALICIGLYLIVCIFNRKSTDLLERPVEVSDIVNELLKKINELEGANKKLSSEIEELSSGLTIKSHEKRKLYHIAQRRKNGKEYNNAIAKCDCSTVDSTNSREVEETNNEISTKNSIYFNNDPGPFYCDKNHCKVNISNTRFSGIEGKGNRNLVHAWLLARHFWHYESPLMDLEEIATNQDIKKKFSTLPEGFIDLRPADMIRKYWNPTPEEGKLGMKHYFMNCVNNACLPPNSMYCLTDASILYAMMLHWGPKKVIEIGSGYSTTVVAKAFVELKASLEGKSDKVANTYSYEHVVIEPFRTHIIDDNYQKGLIPQSHKIRIIPKKVQSVDYSEFDALNSNDILFIDSSHVTQPYGDTLYELIYLLSRVKSGVIVHIHDIFLPSDYPDKWTLYGRRQYTEQWLLALFLNGNKNWEIIWATNLMSKLYSKLGIKKTDLTNDDGGSFWIRRL